MTTRIRTRERHCRSSLLTLVQILLIIVFLFSASASGDADCLNLLQDGGFEAGNEGGYWTPDPQYDIIAGPESIVFGGRPNSGDHWLQFSVTGSVDTLQVSQTLWLPAAEGALLTFSAMITEGEIWPDQVEIYCDDILLCRFLFDLSGIPCSGGWGEYCTAQIPVPAPMDGGLHQFRIAGLTTSLLGWLPTLTINLDDFCLTPVGLHTFDLDNDAQVSLSELLRVIQFFNARSFSCDRASGDGYTPGEGDRACIPHSSDYAPDGPDWQINLTELLRLIQFYNAGGYQACPDAGSEDGFCVGAG